MNATVFALEYGAPLYVYAELALPFVSKTANPIVNTMVPSTTLASPADIQDLFPNVDTLYSNGLFDLSQDDVIVTVPQVDDRYWNFGFYDVYGNNFANVGSIGDNSSGEHLLRRQRDCDEEPKHQQPKKHDEYQGYINSPTTIGNILIRILVKNNGSDLTYVKNLAEKSTLSSICRKHTHGPSGTPLSNATFAPYYNAGANISLAIMGLLAELTPFNPPINASDAAHVKNELAAAGIRNGAYHPPLGLNLSLAFDEFASLLTSPQAITFQNLGNGWERSVPQGLYGSNYLARAWVEYTGGPNELTPDQTLYPLRTKAKETLLSNQSYIYTFSSKPPVTGFWSLTIYHSDGILTANPDNIYSVGDRSNITYPNGELIYGSNATSGTDGPFEVLVQPFNVPPPANWTNNWLPAPANGSQFSFVLRLYGPSPALSDGEWVYPAETLGSAIIS